VKIYSFRKFAGAALLALALFLAGCGGGGGGGANNAAGPDIDGDGIPNTADAFPSDATRFAAQTTVLLAGVTGGTFSAAMAINNSNQVIGLAENSAAEVKGARWTVNAAAGTASAPVTLEPLTGNTYSAAYGINDAGVTVGESKNGGETVAAFWPAGGTSAAALSLTGFAAPAAAYEINNAGQVVGEATVGAVNRAVIWNSTTAAPVALGTLTGGTYSAAYAINESGLVVGEADNSAGQNRAVAWLVSPQGAVTAGPVDLGTLDGHVTSFALGVDASGRVVGESETAAGEPRATLWTINPQTLAVTARTDLGSGGAHAINGADRVAGHLGTPTLASVWDTRNLNLPNNIQTGAAFSQAFGLNDDNLIVGLSGTQGFVTMTK